MNKNANDSTDCAKCTSIEQLHVILRVTILVFIIKGLSRVGEREGEREERGREGGREEGGRGERGREGGREEGGGREGGGREEGGRRKAVVEEDKGKPCKVR